MLPCRRRQGRLRHRDATLDAHDDFTADQAGNDRGASPARQRQRFARGPDRPSHRADSGSDRTSGGPPQGLPQPAGTAHDGQPAQPPVALPGADRSRPLPGSDRTLGAAQVAPAGQDGGRPPGRAARASAGAPSPDPAGRGLADVGPAAWRDDRRGRMGSGPRPCRGLSALHHVRATRGSCIWRKV